MAAPGYRQGDFVVFRILKCSNHPGPRAASISPEPHGEQYQYEVDKYWSVAEVTSSGQVVLQTRRGKRHVVQADNPRLRVATWWEKMIYRNRFPDPAVIRPETEAVSSASRTT